MWFTELASVDNPGREQLRQFITAVEAFLAFVLNGQNKNEFAFLWDGAPELQGLALETFEGDVKTGAEKLRQALRNIKDIPDEKLVLYGLIGRPMRFKLKVLDSIGRRWNQVRAQFSIREWLKGIFAAIDAILNSVVQAMGGVGGVMMEFKDALSSLATAGDSPKPPATRLPFVRGPRAG